jgi:hypothetical protein
MEACSCPMFGHCCPGGRSQAEECRPLFREPAKRKRRRIRRSRTRSSRSMMN